MTYTQANNIYDLLVNIGGAPASQRDRFVLLYVFGLIPPGEYRFIGHLGFGGKYRALTNTVDCYPEDETPERLEIIKRLNEELSYIPNSHA